MEYSGARGTLIHEKKWSRKSRVRLPLTVPGNGAQYSPADGLYWAVPGDSVQFSPAGGLYCALPGNGVQYSSAGGLAGSPGYLPDAAGQRHLSSRACVIAEVNEVTQ